MSNYRKSDSFLHPGKVGRKTGFQVTWTPKRGANGLEDPEDFFLSDDEFESGNLLKTSPAKKLSMRYSKVQELEVKKNNESQGSNTKKSDKMLTNSKSELEQEEDKPAENRTKSPLRDKNQQKLTKHSSTSTDETQTEKIDETNATASSAKPKSNNEAEVDIDAVIKNAEDLGTPIKVTRRTLTSITGSPGEKNETSQNSSQLLLSSSNVTNGTRLTKNMVLNKNTKNLRFQPQNITNAAIKDSTNEEADKVLDTDFSFDTVEKIIENRNVEQNNFVSDLSDEEVQELEKLEKIEITPPSISLSKKTEIIKKPIKSPEKSKENEGGIATAEGTNSSPEFFTPEPEAAEKSESSKKVGTPEKSLEVHHSKLTTTPRIPIKSLYSKTPKKGTPKSGVSISKGTSNTTQKNLKPHKPITTTDIFDKIIQKDDVQTGASVRKMRIPRKAALKIHPTSDLITSGSDDDDFDSEKLNNRKSQSTTPPKIQKMVVPKKSAESKSTPKAKSQRPVRKPIDLSVPIRRSSRARVPPVASWKNEKIVYKTEKINGVIVKSVSNVLHKEDNEPLSLSQPEYRQPNKRPTRKIMIDLSEISEATKAPKKVTKKSADVKKPKAITKTNENRSIKTANLSKSNKAAESRALKSRFLDEEKKNKSTQRIQQPINKSLKRKPTSSQQPYKSSQPHKIQKVASNRSRRKSALTEDEDEDEDNTNNERATEWQNSKEGFLTLPVFEGPGTEKQVDRIVAFAPNSYKNVTIIKNEEEYFKVGTLFDQDSEFCGGGIIELPSGAKKAVKSNHDTYFIFYVIVGQIEVTLSRNTFTVTEGCSFEIPMGNYYQFINTGSAMAKMMFVQSKYIVLGESGSSSDDNDDDDDDDDDDENENSENSDS